MSTAPSPLDPEWYLSAACATGPARSWDGDGTREALAVCAACPVAAACLAEALLREGAAVAEERAVVRGGWTPSMRSRAASGGLGCTLPGCALPRSGNSRALFCRTHQLDGEGERHREALARAAAARKAERDRARVAAIPRDEVRAAARARAEARSARAYAAAARGDDLFGGLLYGGDELTTIAS